MTFFPFRDRSLTVKLLGVSILTGLIVFLCSDYFLTKRTHEAFKEQLKERLQYQAMDGNLRFDTYVKAHYQLARLIVTQQNFIDHVQSLSNDKKSHKNLRVHPTWLPNSSVLRAFTHALYYFLLDDHNRVIEVFNSGGPPPPDVLFNPDQHIVAASQNENFMTTLDGIPYIISSATAQKVSGDGKTATIMLATPIDEELLLFLLPPITTSQIVALTTGFDPYILVSSNDVLLKKGTIISDIKDDFLVIGETIYNYEYSDLLITYTHLMSFETIKQLAAPVVFRDRLRHLGITLMFIVIFTLLMSRLTRRIELQTRSIVDFSEQALGTRHIPPPKGDELTVLENRFKLLSEEVIKSSHNREEFLQTVIESAPTPIYFKSPEGSYIGCNKSFSDFVGLSQEEVINKTVFDLMPHDIAAEHHSVDKKLLETGGRHIYESNMSDSKGKKHNAIFHKATFTNPDGSVGGLVGVVLDITDRKLAEGQLKNAFALLKSLIDSIPDFIFYKNREGVYLGCNQAFASFIGLSEEEIIGKTDLDLFPTDLAEFFRKKDRQMLAKGNFQRNEEWVTYLDGQKVLLDTLKTPFYAPDGIGLGLIGVSRDITEKRSMEKERKNLQGQLRQAQKLEAIGTLAGGIAHDFNNILSAIFGFIELAGIDRENPEALDDDLNEIRNGANRAKDLVKQLLTFSRMTELKKSPLQVSLIIKEALKLIRPSIPSSIKIKRNIQSNKYVLADQTQVHQIIMNLCTNAYQAMKNNEVGVLTISLIETDVEETFLRSHLDAKPGAYLKLTVTDTGKGIEKFAIDKIFDPYFTTKNVGEGTGLGLAVVHGIVIEAGGFIMLDSKVGEGTSFHVYLPVFETESDDEQSSLEKNQKSPKRGSATVMFIDDEEKILDIAERYMEKQGYEISLFSNALEAWQAFETNPDLYDVIVTDMTMPEMSGLKFAEKVFQIAPFKPIILCTGYSEIINREKALKLGLAEFMLKPLDIRELAGVINKLVTRKD